MLHTRNVATAQNITIAESLD